MERYRFTCTVIGKGGHGAMPDEAVDPVTASAMLILMADGMQFNPESRVEFDGIDGGTRYNIIPETVKISGQLYTPLPEAEKCKQKLEDTVRSILASFRANYTLKFVREGL